MSNRVFQDPDAAAGASARAARPGAGLIIAVLAAVLLTFVSTLAWERARQPAPLGAGADIYAVPKSDGRSAAESAARPDQPTSQSDRTLSPPEDRSEPSSQARPALPPRPDQPAKTVAASVANCRATPSESAEVTAKFLRGAEVRMEAQRGSWSNVSRRGQSCWVQTQLLEDS